MTLTLSPFWPAAPRSGTILVQHPAWEAARNAVLDLAAEGPVTVFLTGEPGCGKTWLLRELEASLGAHGFPTMMLLRGDLPIPLSDGAAVLVDEANYMPHDTRAMLATQDRGVVVLADIEPFTGLSVAPGPAPIMIHLRLLDAHEVGPFAADWLQQEGLSKATLDPSGLSRLIEHSGGAVRLVAQLLTAAVALNRAGGHAHFDDTIIDQVAAFRLGAPVPTEAVPTQPVPVPVPLPIAVVDYPSAPSSPAVVSRVHRITETPTTKRFPTKWTVVVGGAIAASALAAVVLPGLLDRPATVEVAAPAAPRLPSLQSADIAAPDVASPALPMVTASNPAPEPTLPSAPVIATDRRPPTEALPTLQAATVPAAAAATPAMQPISASVPNPALAQASAPQAVVPPAAASTLAVAPKPASGAPQPTVIPVIAETAVAPVAAFERRMPGLALVAQRGDTLERLYDDIYRDRRAPPFAEVRAANPRPLKPGTVIVFPEPAGGWGRIQR